MPKYRVYYETVASVTIIVEAEDEEAAEQKAWNDIPNGVCAQCSGWGQPWGLDLGEWDLLDEKPEYGMKAIELVED